MNFHLKFPDDNSILTEITHDNSNDNFKFVRTNKLRTVNYLTYKCSNVGCRAKITLSLDKSKPLIMDLQHNHGPIITSTNINKSSDPVTVKFRPSLQSSLNKSSPIGKTNNVTNKPSTVRKSAMTDKPSDKLSSKQKVINSSNLTSKTVKNRSIISSTPTRTSKNKNLKPTSPPNSTKNVPNTSATSSDKHGQSVPISNYNFDSKTKQTSSKNDVTITINNSLQGDTNDPIVTSTRKKLYIITDSMGRGLADLMKFLLPQLEITQYTYPNALFHQCLDRAEILCSDLTKDDFLFILSGTNNTTHLAPNSCPLLSFKSIANLRYKTNVIVSSILYRHDGSAVQNTNICYANEYLQRKCLTMHINYLQMNGFFKRRHYTSHGLHLNQAGKRTLSIKLRDYIQSHLLSVVDHPRLFHPEHGQQSTFGQTLMDVTPPRFHDLLLEETFSMTINPTVTVPTSNQISLLSNNSLLDGTNQSSSTIASILYLNTDNNQLDNTYTSPSQIGRSDGFFRE